MYGRRGYYPYYPRRRTYPARRRRPAARTISAAKSRPAFIRAKPKAKKSFLGKAGGVVGGLLGGKKGSVVGRAIGSTAGKIFKGIFGKGSYSVKSNTIVNPASYGGSEQIGLMHNDMGTTRVRHREYVRDLPSSTDFENITFAIQPTNTSLFPWLAALAQNYEQYKILGMVFEFRSLSANALNSTNTALGSVSMATQYNSLNPPFSNKQEVLNYQFATSCKPAESMCHPVECDPGQTPNQPLYIRIGDQQTGDSRLYDMGVLNYCTSGMQAADVVIGELWVSYDILLIKPRISSGLGLGIKSAFYTYKTDAVFDDYVGDNAPLGTQAIATFDSIGLTFEYDLVSGIYMRATVTFPIGSEGLYLIQNTYFGNSNAATGAQTIGTLGYSGCTPRTNLYNVTPVNPGGNSDVGINGGVTGCVCFSMDNIISIPDPNVQASIAFIPHTGWVMIPGTSLDFSEVGNFVVTQLNNSVSPQVEHDLPGHFAYHWPKPGELTLIEEEEEKEVPPKVLKVEQESDEETEGGTEAPVKVSKPSSQKKTKKVGV